MPQTALSEQCDFHKAYFEEFPEFCKGLIQVGWGSRRQRCLGVSVDGLWRKGGQTGSNIFRALRVGRAVLNPFTGAGDDRLTRGHIERTL